MTTRIDDRRIGVYNKQGAQWIERDVINTCGIEDVAMASGPFSSNPIFLPPVFVLVSCRGSAEIRAYLCNREGCTRSQFDFPTNIRAGGYGTSIAVSRDGGVAVVSYIGDLENDEDGFVDVYRAEATSNGLVRWIRDVRIDASRLG